MSRDQFKRLFQIFCPSVPITYPARLVGRETECDDLVRTLLAPGRHAVIYGDRGVGKTSIARAISGSFCKDEHLKLIEYQCGTKDTYKDIAGRILSNCDRLTIARSKSDSHEQTTSAGVKVVFAEGGANSKRTVVTERVDLVQVNLTPDGFSSYLAGVDGVVVLDEFDRIEDKETKAFFAETLKALSNYKSSLKFVICGVSNTAGALKARGQVFQCSNPCCLALFLAAKEREALPHARCH